MKLLSGLFHGVILTVSLLPAQTPLYPNYPTETPAKFQPSNNSFDYARRDEMIPMRDGVKLHTVILIPKGAKNAPILLTRTPYNAKDLTNHAASPHLGPILQGYDNAVDVIVDGSYLRVVQDIRGKYGSEGDYVMNRPLYGPQNPTPADDSTDAYDSIDWLVKNIPESNGKVGTLGISYDGFEPLMALVNPHPALKVSVPMNPMVDGWMGDDWFPQRRVPAAEHSLRLRAAGHARQCRKMVERPSRRLRSLHGSGLGGRTFGAAARAWNRSDSGASSWLTRAMTHSGAIRPWTKSSARSRSKCR